MERQFFAQESRGADFIRDGKGEPSNFVTVIFSSRKRRDAWVDDEKATRKRRAVIGRVGIRDATYFDLRLGRRVYRGSTNIADLNGYVEEVDVTAQTAQTRKDGTMKRQFFAQEPGGAGFNFTDKVVTGNIDLSPIVAAIEKHADAVIRAACITAALSNVGVNEGMTPQDLYALYFGKNWE